MLSNTLATARQKLHATDVPMPLKVSYYLRVSCSNLNSNTIRYSSLMTALSLQNSDWLGTCIITPSGILRSSDRAIDQLLNPITALHQANQNLELALPTAA